VASNKDINKMSVVELNSYLAELKESLFNFRFQKSLQQLEHPQKLRHVKRDIARVQTIIKELELGIR
tara:strand:- start:1207 stop:1407 length:201 start_codon:yes stop_codon:yes gene_type:complete